MPNTTTDATPGRQKPEANGKNSSPFLTRIASILMCLSYGANTVTTISHECRCSLSTTHRLLQSLTAAGFIVRDKKHRQYYLGPLFNQVAGDFQLNHKFLLINSIPEISRLSDVTRETIAIRVQFGMLSYHLYEIPSRHNIMVNMQPPQIEPIIPEGPLNKVFIASLNERDVRSLIKSYYIAYAEKPGLPEPAALRAEIREVRQQGFSVSHPGDVKIPGAGAIAVPVSNYSNPVALTLVGLETRMRENLEQFIEELKTSAQRISDNLYSYYQE